MDKKDGDSKKPRLPQLYTMALTFEVISTFVFYSGIVSLALAVFSRDSPFSDIENIQILFPGFFLVVCGMLGDPCIRGMKNVAMDPYTYFSPQREMEKKKIFDRYDQENIAIYTIICMVIGAVLLTSVSNTENGLPDFVFAVMYTITTICYVLLIYFKKHTVV